MNLKKHKGNMKKTWDVIRDILGKSLNKTPASFNVDGPDLYDSKDISDIFNNFFYQHWSIYVKYYSS